MRIQRPVTTAALCLLLVGCGQAGAPITHPSTPAGPSPSATIRSASSGSSTSPTGTTPGSPTTPVPTPTLPTVDLPDYTGPQAMPASDGEPMLWPLSIQVRVDSYSTDPITLYGFLDVHGRPVVPQRYSSYTYCPDASGRAVYLIAERAGSKAEVYDLTGKLVRRAPTASAECGGPGFVIFRVWIDHESNIHNDGLLEVATGRIVVPLAKGRHLASIDETTVNVSSSSGEYFLDLATGRRTPHVGWLVSDSAYLEKGAPGIPARPHRDKGLVGFVSRSGSWALKPRYEDTRGFSRGFVQVQLGEASYTFLDASLHEVGGTWTEIEDIEQADAAGWRTTGYHVTRDGDQALLDAHLKPISPTGKAWIACDWKADSACSVTQSGGASALAVPPSATLTPIPSGYSLVLSSAFVADAGGEDTTRVLALASGASADLGAATTCHAAGTAWVVCDPATDTLAPIVLDQQGRRTALASAEPVRDPVPGAPVAYYEVTGGSYRGIVDATGAWRYRMSLYTRLED